MNSEKPGAGTSVAEVTYISGQGFRLFLGDRELFVSFDQFPWFAEAPAEDILKVERPSPFRLRWPALDVDLSVDSIEHPENYPLISSDFTRRHDRLARESAKLDPDEEKALAEEGIDLDEGE